MSILSLNSGSSSLKFGLFSDRTIAPEVEGEIDWADGNRSQARLTVRPANGAAESTHVAAPDDATAAACALGALRRASSAGLHIVVVGHRVVHGGTKFRESVRIDEGVKPEIRRLQPLAPLHNPPALRTIEAIERALPSIPQVAVFDTSFYAELPPKAYLYPLPYEWHTRWGIRRIGFHGTSHAYCARRAAEYLGRDLSSLRLISCHLGGGCSATAVRGGKAVATTMGFSPLEGLMMGTRCGSVDPGVLLYLQRECGLSLEELDHGLNNSSGLLGVSGVSSDLTKIERAAAEGHERARLAVELFAEQVRRSLGALTTCLGGLDVVTFTDRIGVNSPAMRAAVCEGLEFLGMHLDPTRNQQARPDCDIAAAEAPVRVLVIQTREEQMVAGEAWQVLHP